MLTRLRPHSPTREEMLAADLPFQVPGVSVTPDGKESPVVYRHPTAEAALLFGKAEAEALGVEWPIPKWWELEEPDNSYR